jgi:hypothetical protein
MKKTITLTCENCSKQFDRDLQEAVKRKKAGRRIFCSHKCSSEIRAKESLVDVSCKECGKEFKRRRCEVVENNFCSRSCSNTHSNKKYVGESARNFKHGRSLYRGIALKEYPSVCMVCGFDKEYAIEVHHIDKDRSNNNIENLKVLCANCHLGVHRGKIKINK